MVAILILVVAYFVLKFVINAGSYYSNENKKGSKKKKKEEEKMVGISFKIIYKL